MSIYTTHYNLDKYESTDRPNLRDQYNSAMDKIDGLLYQQAGAVSGATQAVSALQQQVSTNTGNITSLQQDLATTDAKATTAATDASAAAAAAAAAQADIDSFEGKPYREAFRSLSGTTGGKSWSCECHIFQFGTSTGCLQIIEMRGRTIGVEFSGGPGGMYYGNDPVIPNITFPFAFTRTPSTIEQATGSTWVIKEGEASETTTGAANVVRPGQGASPSDIYWSVTAIGNAAALIS